MEGEISLDRAAITAIEVPHLSATAIVIAAITAYVRSSQTINQNIAYLKNGQTDC